MKTETNSIRLGAYPSCLIMEIGDGLSCQYPGCEFSTTDGREIIEHIKQEHPLEDIQCPKCKIRTRLPDEKLCDTCLEEAEEGVVEEKPPKGRIGRPRTKTGMPCPECNSEHTYLKRQHQKVGGQTAKSYLCADCKRMWTTIDGVILEKTQLGENIRLKEKLNAIQKYVRKHPESKGVLELRIKREKVEMTKCKKCGRTLKKYERCKCGKKPKEESKQVGEDPKKANFSKSLKKIIEPIMTRELFSSETNTVEYRTTDGRKIIIELIDVEGTQYATKAWVE